MNIEKKYEELIDKAVAGGLDREEVVAYLRSLYSGFYAAFNKAVESVGLVDLPVPKV